MTDGYIELNARSAFSFLEGASLPEELISTCADFGMPALATTALAAAPAMRRRRSRSAASA